MNVFKTVALGMLMTGGAMLAQAQSADEIIDKHIQAIGGEKVLSGIKSIKRVGGTTIQGMEMPYTMILESGKGMKISFSIMGMNCYIITTPTEGWMYLPVQPGGDKVQPIPKDQLKNVAGKLNIKSALLADKEAMAKRELVGMDTINTEPCYKLKITDKEGNEQTAYFSTKTYYMIRNEVKATVQGEEQEVAMTYSNFQKQPEGIVLAMTESNPMMGGAEIVYKSVEVNKPLPADTFKPTEPVADAKDQKK